MVSMKLILSALLLAFASTAHAFELAAGPSARPQSYALGLRGAGPIAPEVQFVSEGRQPFGIPNINRVLMLNMVATVPLSRRLDVFAKAGITSSRFSTNGSGNGYRNPGRAGYDVGLGATYWLAPQWGLRVETTRMRHQQSDVPAFETFTETTVQIVYRAP